MGRLSFTNKRFVYGLLLCFLVGLLIVGTFLVLKSQKYFRNLTGVEFQKNKETAEQIVKAPKTAQVSDPIQKYFMPSGEVQYTLYGTFPSGVEIGDDGILRGSFVLRDDPKNRNF